MKGGKKRGWGWGKGEVKSEFYIRSHFLQKCLIKICRGLQFRWNKGQSGKKRSHKEGDDQQDPGQGLLLRASVERLAKNHLKGFKKKKHTRDLLLSRSLHGNAHVIVQEGSIGKAPGKRMISGGHHRLNRKQYCRAMEYLLNRPYDIEGAATKKGKKSWHER